MRRAGLAIALGVLLAAAAVWAGNPISVVPSGALRWDTTSAVVWNPDAGNLGTWDNTTAIARVTNAFAQWQFAPMNHMAISYTEGVAIVDGTATPVDVTSANYAAIIALNNGQNPIIFDNDRDIFDLLGTSNSVLGFAGILRTDGSGTITKGYGVLQGDWFDGDSGDVGEVTAIQFRGMFVHEFGHFSGLGHSTVNRHLIGGLPGCAAPTAVNYTTMHPINHSEAITLHGDDVATISKLYPKSTFLTNFGAISGNLLNIDGVTPFDGANVIIRPDTTDCAKLYDSAQAMQSGVNPGDDGGAGGYQFQGLVTPDDWTLFVTAVSGGGSFPIGGSFPPPLPAPDEFYNAANESTTNPPDDPTAFTAIAVNTAGSTVSGISVLLNSVDGPGAISDASLVVDQFDGNTPGPPESLILDDDGLNLSIFGLGGTDQLAWISRFSPTAGQLPFLLDRIDIFFSGFMNTIAVGRSVRLLVYADTAASGSPATATLVHMEDTTIQALDVFNQYTLSSPVLINSGDFYIGAFDLVADATANFIAAADPDTTNATAFVSGIGTDPTAYVPITTLMQPDQTFLIRAHGARLVPAGTIRLSWNDSCNEGTVPGQDYAVYQGTVASLSGVQDQAPIACGTAQEKSYVLPGPAGDVFWLVAPLLASQEGSQGSGTTVPRAPASTCQTVSPGFCP